jgi:hypothetical protein
LSFWHDAAGEALAASVGTLSADATLSNHVTVDPHSEEKPSAKLLNNCDSGGEKSDAGSELRVKGGGGRSPSAHLKAKLNHLKPFFVSTSNELRLLDDVNDKEFSCDDVAESDDDDESTIAEQVGCAQRRRLVELKGYLHCLSAASCHQRQATTVSDFVARQKATQLHSLCKWTLNLVPKLAKYLLVRTLA